MIALIVMIGVIVLCLLLSFVLGGDAVIALLVLSLLLLVLSSYAYGVFLACRAVRRAIVGCQSCLRRWRTS